MFNSVDVLAKGLSAARLRMNVLASNIANAETTRTEEGGPYRRKDVVQASVGVQSSFSSQLDRATLAEPQIVAVVEDSSEPRKVFNPSHPDANKEGYVEYPNINVVQTMTDMMSVTRLYQANITAIDSVSQMSQAAREIVRTI
jgi:flagellar basal-body rod protein FlgC